MPMGYSFNLDGSMMYCTFAVLFIAQAYNIHMPISTQITMLLILGVDTFLDMGRSATNAVGNSIATAVVAKWEGELLSESDAAANARTLDAEASATLAHPAHA
jgi:Na+/H+-dicarboxylate symporter